MTAPIITDDAIKWLVDVEKDVPDLGWRTHLRPGSAHGWTKQGRYDLGPLPDAGPLGGSLHLYARENVQASVIGDWSVGLVYTDYSGRSYRVIRCNGPHPNPHFNRIERETIVGSAHIHLLTERYQRLRRARADGYARRTNEYADVEGALEYLAGAINLQPAGRLLL